MKLIESRWPTTHAGRPIPYAGIQSVVRARLAATGIAGRFSHMGIVVADVRATVKSLCAAGSAEWQGVEPVWGAAFGCHVTRALVEGSEIELLQPVEESFLREHLMTGGEGVHHVSFEVDDLAEAMRVLAAAGEALAYPAWLPACTARSASSNPVARVLWPSNFANPRTRNPTDNRNYGLGGKVKDRSRPTKPPKDRAACRPGTVESARPSRRPPPKRALLEPV